MLGAGARPPQEEVLFLGLREQAGESGSPLEPCTASQSCLKLLGSGIYEEEEAEDSSWGESVLSFQHVDPRNRTGQRGLAEVFTTESAHWP